MEEPVDIKIAGSDDSGTYLIATSASIPWDAAFGDADYAVIGFGASETKVLISPPTLHSHAHTMFGGLGSNHARQPDGAVEMELAASAQPRNSKRRRPRFHQSIYHDE